MCLCFDFLLYVFVEPLKKSVLVRGQGEEKVNEFLFVADETVLSSVIFCGSTIPTS